MTSSSVTSVSRVAPYLLPVLVSLGPGTAGSTSPQGGRSWLDDRAAPLEHLYSAGTSIASTEAPWAVSAPVTNPADWLHSALEKVSAYGSLTDGWKGEGTLSPSTAAIADASDLLYQFAVEMPDLSRPMISADEDGSICLYWLHGVMMANISVHGDGTYSYYAEGFDDPVRSDAMPIGQPLHPQLIATMTGSVVSGLILA